MLNSLIRTLLPHWVYIHLIGNWDSGGFTKYARNTSWLIAARLASFITSFVTIALVARYLGPENLGKINYAQSFTSIFSVFATLGIGEILYRDLIEKPEDQNRIIGTAVASKLVFGLLSLCAAVGLSMSLQDEPLLTALIAMAAFSFIMGPFSTVNILCKARVEAKYVSYVTIFLAVLLPVLKILIIYFDKGVLYFASLLMLEAAIVALWSMFIYMHIYKLNPLKWRFEPQLFKRLMYDSWPFLFAGLFGYIYARIDQVMLQHFIDSTAVGLYSSAVTLTNLWLFIPGIIIVSVFPALINARKENRSKYLRRYKTLTFFITFIAIGVSSLLFILAKPVILLVFGSAFASAIPVLQIYAWSGVFATLGMLVQHYLVAENKGRVHLYLTLTGACINVVLNLVLIPQYGIMGAASATLFSYAVIPLGLYLLPSFRADIKVLQSKILKT